MKRRSAVLIGCLLAGVFASGTVEARSFKRTHIARHPAANVQNLAEAQTPAEAAPGQSVTIRALDAYAAAVAANPPMPPLLAAIFQPASRPIEPAASVVQPAVAASVPAPPEEAANSIVIGGSAMQNLVARHAAANGVPFPLAHAVIMIESKYAARVAHAGNYGLMQIRAETARGMGFHGSAAGLLDAETNLRFGMKYLALAYRLAKGDVCGTVMRYQSGVGTTRMTAANRAYCARARSFMAHL